MAHPPVTEIGTEAAKKVLETEITLSPLQPEENQVQMFGGTP